MQKNLTLRTGEIFFVRNSLKFYHNEADAKKERPADAEPLFRPCKKESLLLEQAAEKHTRPFLMDLEETVQFILSTAIMS
ncbi:hypothetical protein B8V81_1917 [Paenibacillus pasadenensis]|uniref:Uncharacterized protein n=1 Tax=Paenibacillus pasadenensis TaxID=217090 RepID=A0A2N5NBJ1_9BACL|nr:hypothetical protein B8V81_1917 [Paenibacillus pasadenensis]